MRIRSFKEFLMESASSRPPSASDLKIWNNIARNKHKMKTLGDFFLYFAYEAGYPDHADDLEEYPYDDITFSEEIDNVAFDNRFNFGILMEIDRSRSYKEDIDIESGNLFAEFKDDNGNVIGELEFEFNGRRGADELEDGLKFMKQFKIDDFSSDEKICKNPNIMKYVYDTEFKKRCKNR